MPELPEVETVKRLIDPHIIGEKIKFISGSERKLFKKDQEYFKNKVENQTIKNTYRIGKHLLIRLSNLYSIYIHLGMSGQLFVSKKNPQNKHQHLALKLNSNKYLIFNDPRMFGVIDLFPTALEFQNNRLKNLGEDALLIKDQEFIKNIKGKNTKIKAALLDQTVLAGVGNIYADESLFMTGIHPETKTKEVSDENYKSLLTNIKKVMLESIDNFGTSVTYSYAGEGNSGQNQFYLKVYGRTNQECYQCGYKIQRIKIAQRSSHFCKECQK